MTDDLFGYVVPAVPEAARPPIDEVLPVAANPGKDKQVALFEAATEPAVDDSWRRLWRGMPEFIQSDGAPLKTIQLHFKSEAAMAEFARLIGQPLGMSTRFLWFPREPIGRLSDKRYTDSDGVVKAPRHPVYVVSKGRWLKDRMLTSRWLSRLGVPHFIVVEEPEVEFYEASSGLFSPWATVLTLDPRFKRDYDTFDDLGDSKGKGPGAARNFAWEHSVESGASWHWVMDDNINGFFRLNRNLKTPVATGTIFRCMEAFVERYANVGMAGPNYFMFASRKTVVPPFYLNTRIYSCNLIRNDLPYRWRGRYNEDTDLSIRMLKGELVTVLFNAFLQMKLTTQTVGGGCNDMFYKREGTRPKSEMAVAMHPEITKLVERWGRWHHYVDYSGFKQRPIPRLDAFIADGVDDYGLTLEVDDWPDTPKGESDGDGSNEG